MNRSTTLRRSIGRLASMATRTGRRSVVLGALLLAASTATVLATGNTQPTITSATVSRSVLKEGETVTLSFSFTDPDVADYHALRIRWGDGLPTEQVNIPFGQRSIQVNHTYADDTQSDSHWNALRVMLYDRQSAPGSAPNDNSGGAPPNPEVYVPIQVGNLPPSFVSPGVTVTKKGASMVVVEGNVVDPGSADQLQVSALWGDPMAPGATACSMSHGTRHFVCEHAYRPNLQPKTYSINLTVKDDEGALGKHLTTVQLP